MSSQIRLRSKARHSVWRERPVLALAWGVLVSASAATSISSAAASVSHGEGFTAAQASQSQAVGQPANNAGGNTSVHVRVLTPSPKGSQKAGDSACDSCKDYESKFNDLRKDLEARIDKDSKDAGDRIDKGMGLAQWVLTVMIALAGVVFPLVGGLAAWFQIKQARDDAKEQVESIRKRFDEIVDEYQKNFPQFTAMDARMHRLLSEMKQRMPSEDDFNNPKLFGDMPEANRQYIADSEFTVAAISVFELGRSPSLRAQISSIYRIFVRFYNLRDNTFKSATDSDFVRADSYATRFIDLNRESSEGYRMRGAIYLDRYRLLKDATPPPDKDKLEELLKSAELYLDEAIDKCAGPTSDEVDAGAFYNRALAHYYREQWEAAVAVSKQLIGLESKVSRSQREQYLPSVYVNLASFLAKRAKLAASENRPADAQKLSTEAVQAITRGVRDFEKTTMQDGGLARLKAELASELSGGQELSQLDNSFVVQLWAMAKS